MMKGKNMKTDENGCSTCPPGEERYESFFSEITGRIMIQYDYRTLDGKLFSCVRKTVEDCRLLRDQWLL